jgi:hypothetical protein
MLEIKESAGRLKGRGGVRLACLVVVILCACSSYAGSTSGDANKPARAFYVPAGATAPTAGDSETADAASDGALDFTLVNFTRFNLYSIYVSPHDSAGWEENILGREQLFDGDTVKIRFNPSEKAVRWDLRVEDENGNNAEWKNLNLREISRITLRTGNDVVIAEAE